MEKRTDDRITEQLRAARLEEVNLFLPLTTVLVQGPSSPSLLPPTPDTWGELHSPGQEHETLNVSHETLNVSHETPNMSHETHSMSHETLNMSHETLFVSH